MSSLPDCLVLAALTTWAAGGACFLTAGVIALAHTIRRARAGRRT